MKFIVLIVLSAAVLSGCSTQYRVSKDSGGSEQQTRKDDNQCREEASFRGFEYGGYSSGSVEIDEKMFFACMRERGYQITTR